MTGIGDTTLQAVEYALDGLKTRADVLADNIANLNTPGFRGARVDFESTLRAALADGRIDEPLGPPSVRGGVGLPDAQGNTVNLEDEVTSMMKTNLEQQAMVNAANFKVGVLRTAITGR